MPGKFQLAESIRKFVHEGPERNYPLCRLREIKRGRYSKSVVYFELHRFISPRTVGVGCAFTES